MFLELQKLNKNLEQKQTYTSFGTLPLGNERTSENRAFAKASRASQEKVFLGQLTVQENVGKKSPGPIYSYEDEIKYQQVSLTRGVTFLFQIPKYSFGTDVKLGEIKPKYDHYDNAFFLDDPVNADNKRRKRVLASKIGTEPRVRQIYLLNKKLFS